MLIKVIITHLSHQVILRDIERMDQDDGDEETQEEDEIVDNESDDAQENSDDGDDVDEGGEYENIWVWTIERARLLNYRAQRVILACV